MTNRWLKINDIINTNINHLKNQLPLILKEKLPEILNNIGENNSDLISQKTGKKFSEIKVIKTEVDKNIFLAKIESANDPKILAYIGEVLKLQPLNRYILKASMEERKENKK